jgi:hypothetical protein
MLSKILISASGKAMFDFDIRLRFRIEDFFPDRSRRIMALELFIARCTLHNIRIFNVIVFFNQVALAVQVVMGHSRWM